jgi:hypothetical protein
MSDIFGYDRKIQGNVLASTEASKITADGAGGSAGGNAVGLAQNVQLSYQQNINDIFEIGSSDLFWIGGRPSGDGTIARLVSTKAGFGAIQSKMQLCTGGATLIISFGTACKGSAAGSVTLGAAVLMSKTFGMDTQNLLVTENMRMKFGVMTES